MIKSGEKRERTDRLGEWVRRSVAEVTKRLIVKKNKLWDR